MSNERQWARTLARRILAGLSRFEAEADVEASFRAELIPGETVIGVYRGGTEESQSVVVSDEALVFHDGGIRRVPFSEMRTVKVGMEGAAKTQADRLHIETSDGTTRTVTVAG
jgi:hypothetical protein